MKKTAGLFVIDGYEVTDNILDVARSQGRALIRVNFRANSELTNEEKSLLDTIANEGEREVVKADLIRLKAERFTQLVTLNDLGITPVAYPTDTALQSAWDYFTPAQSLLAAKPKMQICTAYTASIVELLTGTPFCEGVDESGKPIPITGVTNSEGRVYATHSRVYFGLHSDENEALQTLRNGLLRNIAEDPTCLGVNDTEKAAIMRKLNV